MNRMYVEIIGEGGIRLWRIEYIRSRRRKPINLDRYITIAMNLMGYSMAVVLFIATLPRILEVLG